MDKPNNKLDKVFENDREDKELNKKVSKLKEEIEALKKKTKE